LRGRAGQSVAVIGPSNWAKYLDRQPVRTAANWEIPLAAVDGGR
jgi:hypothetical protein